MFRYSNKVFHDSCKASYRNPVGTLRTGESVTLRLYAKDVALTGARVRVCGDGYADEFQMHFVSGWWEAIVYLPDKAGVYWYCFVLHSEDETTFYGCKSGTTSGLGEAYRSRPLYYQLTVYERDFQTPEFYKNAIMYQIFPDRFSRSTQGKVKEGVAYHKDMGRKAILHGSFEEAPMYKPLPGEQYYSPCDYFGGDLIGIEQSLTYFAELGVSALYLNPIFEADSNHRYNTSDYMKIDPILGTNADFARLCSKAKKLGIRIVLDGVFSHTGSDSVYFNSLGNYDSVGAAQSKESPYYSWYEFYNYPHEYRSWWGFDTLPEVNEYDPSWQEFIIKGEDSVTRHWLREGAGGYRLDVADELPDDIIELIRGSVKSEDSENLLLGEVWEDATTKQSYGRPRTYSLGKGLDSVMNYPFRNAVINFLLGHINAYNLTGFLSGQATNYPKPMYYCLMNLISSHDIERFRTIVGTGQDASNLSRDQQASFTILPEQDKRGGVLQRLAVVLQFVIPGMPSIYYGDETGMHGLKDPFNRAPFGIYDNMLVYFYKTLSKIRRSSAALRTGHVGFFNVNDDIAGVFRFILDGKDAFDNPSENGAYIVLINRSDCEQSFILDIASIKSCISSEQLEALHNTSFTGGICLVSGKKISFIQDLAEIEILPESAMVIKLSFV